MKIYSPTSTQDFMRCQRLWALRQMGWRSAFIGYPDVAMSTGTGIHRVGERVHKHIIEHGRTSPMALSKETIALFINDGIESATADVRARIEKGSRPLDKLEDWEQRVSDNVKRGGLAYLSSFDSIIPKDWTINEAELAFGAEDRSKEGYEGCADILITDDYGLAIADIKTKTAFKTDYYRESFITQFRHSWQMLQYSWLTQRHYGELPKRFYLIMVEMKTKPVVSIHAYRLDPEELAAWEHTVVPVWAQMEQVEEGLAVPGIAAEHTAYGRLCPMYSACYTHRLDQKTMKMDYINIKEG